VPLGLPRHPHPVLTYLPLFYSLKRTRLHSDLFLDLR
jgi:hypothetical protein